IQLGETRQKLRPQGRFEPFAVIQKLAPAGRALQMPRAFLDGTRLAVDRWEQAAIGFEMVEPGAAADGFGRRIRALHVGKHDVQLVLALHNFGPAEWANTVGIVVREVNAYPTIRIGRVAPKAAKLLP